jgi:predicted acyltransferase
MNSNAHTISSPLPGRVTSVDFFRGLTMFLLAGEAAQIYEHFLKFDSRIMQFIGTQFTHHEWHGLHFWDLIQPFFMFIVGVAIPFAVANRRNNSFTDRSCLPFLPCGGL